MLWIDVAVALVALVLLGLAALKLWRTIRALSRQVKDASARIEDAGAGLAAVQAQRPQVERVR